MRISRELKLGSFVVAILVIAFFVINYLRGEDILDREIDLTTSYNDVESLVVSDPVYIKGYKAGRVDKIVYNPKTDMFDVTCSVFKQFRIPKDSKLTIYSIDIMGGKGVKVELGSSSELVKDGDYLASSSIPDMIESLGSSIGPLLAKVTNTMDSLSVTISAVNSLLDSNNRDKLSKAISHLDRTMSNLEKLSSSVSSKSEDIEGIITNLSLLEKKLDKVADSADGALTGLADIEASVKDDLTGAVSSLKNLLEKVNDPDGTIGKLLVDNSAYNSLDSLLSDIDKIVQLISENPKKYLRISVF